METKRGTHFKNHEISQKAQKQLAVDQMRMGMMM